MATMTTSSIRLTAVHVLRIRTRTTREWRNATIVRIIAYRCRAAQALQIANACLKYEEPSDENGGACILCAAGKFKTNNGTAPCQLCPSGKISTVTGSETSTDCIICPAGTYTNENQTECHSCPPGQSSHAGASTCTACINNTFSDNHNSSNCSICQVNSVANDNNTDCLCNPGYTLNDTGACIACVAGTYKTINGQQTVRHARKEPSVDQRPPRQKTRARTVRQEPTPTRLACRHVITVSSMRHPLQQVRISAIVTVNPAMKAGRTTRALPVRRASIKLRLAVTPVKNVPWESSTIELIPQAPTTAGIVLLALTQTLLGCPNVIHARIMP